MDRQHDKSRDAKPEPKPTIGGQEIVPDLNRQQQAVMSMQRLVGNGAVQRLLDTHGSVDLRDIQRQEVTTESSPTVATERPYPTWATDRAVVGRIQRELRRLGLYMITVDRIYGGGTDSGLVEAFGGDNFRTMEADAVLEQLRAAEPPARADGERRGHHDLRYGEMFRDGLLDMTVGIGHDESGIDRITYERTVTNLTARGFAQDHTRARELYEQAGRTFTDGEANQYFVRENALTYQPPVGDAREIHGVIRLLFNETGDQGAEAASGFREGMVESDVSYYAGHGRYGSGPDFDRNFASFVLQPLPGETDPARTILDYEELETVLAAEGRRSSPRRSAWRQFLWRTEQGLLQTNISNEGNIRMNERDMRPRDFGSHLIRWALNEGHISADTGRDGALAEGAAEHPERRYRVIVFDGCQTNLYEQSLRGTPGFGRDSTHTIGTTRDVYLIDYADTLATFLDSILRQQSAERIARNMDAVQGDRLSGTFTNRGTTYDPVVR